MCHADEKYTLVKEKIQLSRFVELGIVHAVLVTHILSTECYFSGGSLRSQRGLSLKNSTCMSKQALPDMHYSLPCFSSHNNPQDDKMTSIL